MATKVKIFFTYLTPEPDAQKQIYFCIYTNCMREMDNFKQNYKKNKIKKKNIENLIFHAYPKSNKQEKCKRG